VSRRSAAGAAPARQPTRQDGAGPARGHRDKALAFAGKLSDITGAPTSAESNSQEP
jgi:hypothetical protein